MLAGCLTTQPLDKHSRSSRITVLCAGSQGTALPQEILTHLRSKTKSSVAWEEKGIQKTRQPHPVTSTTTPHTPAPLPTNFPMALHFPALGKLADEMGEAVAAGQAEEGPALCSAHAKTATVTATRGRPQNKAEGTCLVCGSRISLHVLPANTNANQRLPRQHNQGNVRALSSPSPRTRGKLCVSQHPLAQWQREHFGKLFLPPTMFYTLVVPSHAALLSLHFCPGT